MGTINKTIALTGLEGTWVQSQVDSGRYANESDHIRDLIRSDHESRLHIDMIRNALIDAENSGEPEPFDVEEFKQEMTQK